MAGSELLDIIHDLQALRVLLEKAGESLAAVNALIAKYQARLHNTEE